MKKKFRLFGFIMTALFVAVGLTACGNDDDDFYDPADFNYQDVELFGSWQRVTVDKGWTETETITFNENGTYSETEVETNGIDTRVSWDNGKWYTNQTRDHIRFRITDSSDRSDIGDVDIDDYIISNGVLILDGDRYQPVVIR